MKMTEEERQPLIIHPNPGWNASNRRQVTESSGEYITVSSNTGTSNSYSSGLHINRDYVRMLSASTSPSAHVKVVKQEKQNNGGLAGNRTLRGASGTILICVILERIAFYGITGNLVLFLNKNPFYWESYNAMGTTFILYGITYIFSLIGGWIADSFLGRFKTLIIAFVFYLCGMVIMPFIAATSESANSTVAGKLPLICGSHLSINSSASASKTPVGLFEENCAWLIYVTLILIAIGCGILKANICPFGSDQLTGASPTAQFSFFNWYYWCVNIGSIIAISVITYIEQQRNFQLGYIICAGALGCAFIVFLSGSFLYKRRPPDGSVLTNIFRIIRVAWRIKNQRKKEQRLNERIAECPSMHEVAASHQNISFLDHAKHQFGGIFHSSLVEDVKKFKMILAVFSVGIPYWVVYFQMQTTFFFQGLHMRLGSGEPHRVNISNPSERNSSGHEPSFVLVAAWFTLFDAATVIIILPLLDRVIYPFFEKRGYHFSFARRIILGMIFALASMIVAGIVEYFRLQAYWPYPDEPCVSYVINQEIGNTCYNASDMSVFWQIPQYVLIGISEVFASVASLQFAVSVSPKSMKTVITGLYYLFTGIGSFTGTAIISILYSSKTWFYANDFGNINCRLPCKHNDDVEFSCHLDYYFYLLAGLEFIALLLFIFITHVFGLNRSELLVNPQMAEHQGSTTAISAQRVAGGGQSS